MAIKPEDIIGDNENTIEINGIKVRKGTVGAVLANIDIFSSSDSTQTDKEEAKNMIVTLAPAMIATGFLKHATWKNPEVQQIFEAASSKI